MAQELMDDDVGATVRTPDGDSLGRVVRVERGTAYVEPGPEAPETVLATLGWNEDDGNGDSDEYPLPRTAIDVVDDEAITLRRGAGDADRSAGADHDSDADLARESDEEGGADASEAARERAREEEAQQDVEESIEREAAARESSNPDAHRDEEPFNS